MADNEGHPVKLYVYDLSRGMAQAMSISLTGRQIGRHTSVVVYGQEYYFGQGIQVDRPGTTVHGNPLRVIDMGVTFLPQEIFVEFLENIRERFSAEKYHLLDHNCNTFSSEAIRFLVDKSIPEYITDLPADFLRTPFGQQMRPLIESFFGPSQLRPAAIPAAQPTAPSSVKEAALVPKRLLYEARNLATLNNLLSSNRAVVVYFTSQGCPPCRVIAPEFQRLITDPEDFDGTVARKPIIGVTVDTGAAYDIAMHYQIRGTPTFMFFLDGKKDHEFSGANLPELKSSISLLRFTAYPPHPHEKLDLPALKRFSAAPILFATPPKTAAAFGKLREFITAYEALGGRTLLGESHRQHFESLEQCLPTDKAFPLLDLVRVILLSRAGRAHYASSKGGFLTNALLQNIARIQLLTGAIHCCRFNAACHLFVEPATSDWTLSTAKYSLPPVGYDTKSTVSPHEVITGLLVQSLLAEDASTRRAAASLAFNVATRVCELRAGTEHSEGGVISDAAETNIQNDDAWLIECASAVVEALRNEGDEEIGKQRRDDMQCHFTEQAWRHHLRHACSVPPGLGTGTSCSPGTTESFPAAPGARSVCTGSGKKRRSSQARRGAPDAQRSGPSVRDGECMSILDSK
ncbi:PPPDE putative peptidase domain-containing protein [Syncephalis pseudoplumigaleata]|uniref:PPPDE putative peptidase domain-containing protein n=1 Tax=Syncephalis pseudoplumigaleata TaxID=1712513 RepID=A0A4P9Z521_9FUNG|nr:PPPDE putative peptidase domain-containing protein [Syncephalis pseudoplumigaleata]|eukprot:RKP26690.1 PPPDE putative peptidase domain-containing protein [Syncephalis pseudoplumigaleata]